MALGRIRRPAGSHRVRAVRATPRWIMGVAVVALLVISELVTEGPFFSKSSFSTLTPFVGVMVIASLGQALVIGTGGIDLSIPSIMTFVGVAVLQLSDGRDGRLASTVVVVLGACAVIGLLNGVLVERLRLNPFVATLAVGQIVEGVARFYRGPVPSVTRVPQSLVDGTRWNVAGVSVALLIAVILTVAGTLVFGSTVWGRRLVASSASETAAGLIGLRSGLYRIAAYVLAATLAGAAAILLAGLLGSPDLSLGGPYLLATVVVVVLSGASLTGGRLDLIGVGLAGIFITVLDHDLRVQGYSSGLAQLAQAIVFGGGLAVVYLVPRRGELAAAIRSRIAPPASA